MSVRAQETLKPKSLVFVNVAQDSSGKMETIYLVAVHVEELRAKGKPRVIDKLMLNFQSKAFDKNASKQIVGFLNLQAVPVCLLIDDGHIDQLSLVKQNLKIWNENVCNDVWYSCLKINIDECDAHSSERASMSQGPFSVFNWVKENQVEFLGSMVPKRFSTLTCEEGNVEESSENETVVTPEEILVFLDLEATGLYSRKITEICMKAVTKPKLVSERWARIPNDCDTIRLAIDPKIEISFVAKSLSKLTRDMLIRSGKQCFNEKVALAVCLFIQRYSGSVCLVAHSGNRFDFDVLRTHLNEFPSLKRSLSEVKTLDTFLGFKNFAGMPRHLGLAALYKACFGGEPPESHTAEGDVVALMRVVNCLRVMLRGMKKSDFLTARYGV